MLAVNANPTLVTIDAPLFYVALECLSAFFCFLSSTFIRQSSAISIRPSAFRPRLLTTVGTLHLLHAFLLLADLSKLNQWMFAPERFLQIGMCWAIVLNCAYARGKYLRLADTSRLAVLLLATLYCAYKCYYQFISQHYVPIGLGVSGCWLAALSVYYEAEPHEPLIPIAFREFCLLGFLSHIVVVIGSRQLLDGPFFMGAIIRTGQYAFLLFALLSDHFFGYSALFWAERQLQDDTRRYCADAAEHLDETRKLVNEAQAHIPSNNPTS